MKPRVKASLLAIIASLGLMGGCKDNKKIQNSNVEVTATILEETPEPTKIVTPTPTIEPTEVPTEKPTATPTIEPTEVPTEKPTATPTIEPTSEPKDEMPRIPLIGEFDMNDLNRTVILEPGVHMVINSAERQINQDIEDGWTNGNVIVPYLPEGYGYVYVGIDEEDKSKPYVWIYFNVDPVEKNLNTRADMYVQSVLLDQETKKYETLNQIWSDGSFGKVYENTEDYSEFENMYGDNFYKPHSHVIYYSCDYSEIFDNYGNFKFEIPDGYTLLGAIDLENNTNVGEVKSSGKVVLFFANEQPILVEEDVKLPGKVVKREKTLTLHI